MKAIIALLLALGVSPMATADDSQDLAKATVVNFFGRPGDSATIEKFQSGNMEVTLTNPSTQQATKYLVELRKATPTATTPIGSKIGLVLIKFNGTTSPSQAAAPAPQGH